MRKVMRAAGADVLLVFGSRAAGHEVQWLSGYPVSGEAVLVFPLDGEPTLLVHYENHVPDARRLSVFDDVRARGEDGVAAVVANLHARRLDGVATAGPLSFQRSRSPKPRSSNGPRLWKRIPSK